MPLRGRAAPRRTWRTREQRVLVPVAAWRWATGSGLVPAADVGPGRWSRAVVEATDPAGGGPGGAAGSGRGGVGSGPADGGPWGAAPDSPAEGDRGGSRSPRPGRTPCLPRRCSRSSTRTRSPPSRDAGTCPLCSIGTSPSPDQAARWRGARRVDFDAGVRLGWLLRSPRWRSTTSDRAASPRSRCSRPSTWRCSPTALPVGLVLRDHPRGRREEGTCEDGCEEAGIEEESASKRLRWEPPGAGRRGGPGERFERCPVSCTARGRWSGQVSVIGKRASVPVISSRRRNGGCGASRVEGSSRLC